VRRTHIGVALLLIPTSLFCLLWLVPNNTVPPTSVHDVDSGFVPSLALGAILFYSVILLVRELQASPDSKRELDEEFGVEATGIDKKVLLNMVILVVTSTISWLLITYVGFEPAMTLLVAATMYYVGVRSWMQIGLCAVIIPIVLSLCTLHFFSTELPGFWK
jgi:hypothetical protein